MKLLDSVRDRLWPWSELRRLRALCHEHWELGQHCLALLDHLNPPWKHLRGTGDGEERVWAVSRETLARLQPETPPADFDSWFRSNAIFAFRPTPVPGLDELRVLSCEEWMLEQVRGRGGKQGEYDA